MSLPESSGQLSVPSTLPLALGNFFFFQHNARNYRVRSFENKMILFDTKDQVSNICKAQNVYELKPCDYS